MRFWSFSPKDSRTARKKSENGGTSPILIKTPMMGMRLASLEAEGGKTRVATRAGASGVALDPTAPRVAASRICSSLTQMLGNRAI